MAGAPGQPEFVYVGDPMCSWCWGFAPVLKALRQRYAMPVHTVVGGLRPGPAAQPVDELRAMLAHHWQEVTAASGQPFNHALLEREGLIYDTEPSCRAVVAMREVAPEHTLAWFARLQRAFYVEGHDLADLNLFPTLLDGFDVDAQRYGEVLRDEATRQRTWGDFEQARGWGVMGFPTLLLRDGDRVVRVTAGFLPWERLEPPLTAWLQEQYGPTAEGLMCSVEGDC